LVILKFAGPRHHTLAAAGHPDRETTVKIVKNVLLVLCVCSLCSKAVMHTYRHFHSEPATIVGP
jgi:hypothetical protein